MNKNIEWKKSNIDIDKLNQITHKSLISSQPKSEEHKNRISQSSKGKKISVQHLENIKKSGTLFGHKEAWNKGLVGYKTKPHSEETKQKMREKALGKQISEKQKQIAREKNSIPIIATNIASGEKTEYSSTKQAKEVLGLTGILHVLKGRYKQCGGYYFEYKK